MKFLYRILFFSILFLSIADFAFAAVVINEVQIAPTDGRFIELYNTSDSDVDLTGWYIQRKTATGSSFGSLVTSTKFESKSIKGGGYFLISRNVLTNSDIVVDTLTLTESNTIRLRDSNGEDVDLVEWGSMSEGESYQRTSASSWILASPTPHAANTSVVTTSSNTSQQEISTTSAESGSATSTGSGSSFLVEPQIFASAGEKKRTATVGGTTSFSGRVWGLKKEPIENARMLWNFGDGSTGEGKNVLHTYRYPGTYIVTLDASSGYYSASDRVTVEAVTADVIISSIGDSQSSFVELYNKSRYELDLSFWSIRAGNLTFIIPQHTFVAAGAKIKFASEVTGFTSNTLASVALYYPNGVLAYTYSPIKLSSVSSSPTNNTQPVVVKKIVKEQLQSNQENINNAVLSQNTITQKELPEENTQAALVGTTRPETPSIFWWITGVCALAIVGIASAFFTKRNPSLGFAKNEADTYEIIEETEDDKIPF